MATVMERAIDAATFRLAPIAEAPPPAIETLLDLAFGADRHGRTAYRLRDGVAAEAGGELRRASMRRARWSDRCRAGRSALFARRRHAATPLWLVGPIAVHPDARSEGIGRAMLRRALGGDRPRRACPRC